VNRLPEHWRVHYVNLVGDGTSAIIDPLLAIPLDQWWHVLAADFVMFSAVGLVDTQFRFDVLWQSDPAGIGPFTSYDTTLLATPRGVRWAIRRELWLPPGAQVVPQAVSVGGGSNFSFSMMWVREDLRV